MKNKPPYPQVVNLGFGKTQQVNFFGQVKQLYINESYECPHCGHHSTLGNLNVYTLEDEIDLKHNKQDIVFIAIECPNSNCHKLFSEILIGERIATAGNPAFKINYEFQLIPDSNAKVFPDYIPQNLRNDYIEACKIINLSPKASATLARRCLQGVIRDYWQIKNKPNLKQEIEALNNLGSVDTTIIDAFNYIRGLGNIGAHMEKDVNLIIDIEPNEAQELIKFIEFLFKETYIASERKRQNLENLKSIADQKNQLKCREELG